MTKYLGLTGLLCSLATAGAFATPEPKPTPTSWELTLQPSQPMRIQIDGKLYWYMVYTVTNSTGQDVDFHPEIVRVSEIDTNDVKPQPGSSSAPRIVVEPAMLGVSPRVFKAIQERYAKTQPFMVSPIKAIDRLLQGKDNARTSVAIFPELDPRAQKFTIYFGGLSGEHESKPNPEFDPKKPISDVNPRFFVIRKTLSMPFGMPGDSRTRANATPAPGPVTWVMR